MDLTPYLRWGLFLGFFLDNLQQCRTQNAINLFEIDTNMNGFIASTGYLDQWTMTRSSKLQCASSCMTLTGCVSFFVDSNSSLCQFHSAIFTDTLGMTSSGASVYYKISSNTSTSGCGTPPAPSNGHFTLVNGTTIGAVADLICNTGYLPFESTITCTLDGWSNLTLAVCRECPSGWTRYQNTCYYLGNTELFNYAAQAVCDTFDSDVYSSSLVKFDSEAEREYVRGLMNAHSPQPSYGFWIGLYQLNDTNGSEAWLPSGQPLDDAVKDWNNNSASQEPNEDSQRCSSAYRSFDYRWTDIECANVFNSDTDGRTLFALCEIDL